jgi:hypothetical protein
LDHLGAWTPYLCGSASFSIQVQVSVPPALLLLHLKIVTYN